MVTGRTSIIRFRALWATSEAKRVYLLMAPEAVWWLVSGWTARSMRPITTWREEGEGGEGEGGGKRRRGEKDGREGGERGEGERGEGREGGGRKMEERGEREGREERGGGEGEKGGGIEGGERGREGRGEVGGWGGERKRREMREGGGN